MRQLHRAWESTNTWVHAMLDSMACHLEHRLALRVLQRERTLIGHQLCWLALQGRTRDVLWLIEHAVADVNATDKEGDPALNLAAGHGHTDTVCLLLEHGATPTARDHQRATPLTFACLNGHTLCAKALLKAKADGEAAAAQQQE